eukprot:COSAG01_NODE_4681_length_4821_cov_3.217493_2_plen_80_part_00
MYVLALPWAGMDGTYVFRKLAHTHTCARARKLTRASNLGWQDYVAQNPLRDVIGYEYCTEFTDRTDAVRVQVQQFMCLV